jgi:uncharacterized repeat protein (TIGR03803 family)
VILDNSGNLYGVTGADGQNGGGTFFKLTPSNGQWTFTVLYSLPDPGSTGLVMDTAGNFYGATEDGGQYTVGSVFKLTLSNGSWTYTSLHVFTDGSDGGYPSAGVTLDGHGNLYGTTYVGGKYGNGVVYEITP